MRVSAVILSLVGLTGAAAMGVSSFGDRLVTVRGGGVWDSIVSAVLMMIELAQSAYESLKTF